MIGRTGNRMIGRTRLWLDREAEVGNPALSLGERVASVASRVRGFLLGWTQRHIPTVQAIPHPISRWAGRCSPDLPISRSPDWCIFIVLFLFVAVPGAATTDPLEEFVHQFESSYHDVRTIRSDFTQTYESGGKTRIESGIVYFARGGLMRWDYERPQRKLFLSDGKTLMLYIPEEKQLTRSPLKASDDIRIPFRLLLSRLDLRRVFSRIEFAPDALEHQPSDRVLRAYPKKGLEGEYHQVLMVVGAQFDIRRLLVTLPDQSTMEFSFDHVERNAPVSRSLFGFTPPPGTEVIDQH